MSLILNIEVTGKTGYVSIADTGKSIDSIINNNQMEHASFLQPAIKKLLERNVIGLHQLSAIAVSNGPGSYTGLRVGLAAAKGMAFALNIPLITINTLELIACGVSIEKNNNTFFLNRSADDDGALQGIDGATLKSAGAGAETLICPMIDARRMEVFFGLYNRELKPLAGPSTAVIDEYFLSTFLTHHQIIFAGSGCAKLQNILLHRNALFRPEPNTAEAFAKISDERLAKNLIANLVNEEPFYCKDFYEQNSKPMIANTASP